MKNQLITLGALLFIGCGGSYDSVKTLDEESANVLECMSELRGRWPLDVLSYADDDLGNLCLYIRNRQQVLGEDLSEVEFALSIFEPASIGSWGAGKLVSALLKRPEDRPVVSAEIARWDGFEADEFCQLESWPVFEHLGRLAKSDEEIVPTFIHALSIAMELYAADEECLYSKAVYWRYVFSERVVSLEEANVFSETVSRIMSLGVSREARFGFFQDLAFGKKTQSQAYFVKNLSDPLIVDAIKACQDKSDTKDDYGCIRSELMKMKAKAAR